MNTRRKERRRKRRVYWIIGVLVVLAAAMLAYAYILLHVKVIEVRGADKHTAQEIADASGLYLGQSIFSYDEGEVTAAVSEVYPDVVVTGVERDYPDRLIITVYERQPELIMINDAGANVMVDREGYILSMAMDVTASYPRVTGFPIVTVSIGHRVAHEDDFNLQTMTTLYEYLLTYSLVDQVAEIDMLNINSIKLEMVDGITIKLGQADKLEDKFRWIISVYPSQTAQYAQGTLDVSAADFASFQPPATPTPEPTPTPDPFFFGAPDPNDPNATPWPEGSSPVMSALPEDSASPEEGG